jgi:energy-converting hydrogenase A subunit M
MQREIKLSGGEITILKSIGLGGISISGKQLLERVGEMDEAQLMDDLNGMIMTGYVLSDKVNLYKSEDVERASLRVNASYARDLKEALNPGRRRDQDTRRRRRG